MGKEDLRKAYSDTRFMDTLVSRFGHNAGENGRKRLENKVAEMKRETRAMNREWCAAGRTA